MIKKSPEDRFYDKVDWGSCAAGDTCWHWIGARTGAISGERYGSFQLGSKIVKAHRASWIIHNGEIPNGLCVLHTCDRPGCVNPDHLFLGSHQDNMKDMTKKGRRMSLPGESNPNSKLTKEQAAEIRKLYSGKYGELSSLGRRFGVTHQMIRDIVIGNSWPIDHENHE